MWKCVRGTHAHDIINKCGSVYVAPMGDAAVDVIDRSGKEQAAMSRHEIFPMRGRGNPILRRTPTMQQCEGCHPCQ